MPSLHPIGFTIPFVIAILYAPRGLFYLLTNVPLYFGLAAIATYAFPFWHSNGVGFVPFYLALMVIYAFGWTGRPSSWSPSTAPMAALIPYSFASVAIPDFFRTWEGGGIHWTVGGAGFDDGLIKFWLWMPVVVIPAWAFMEWAKTKDQKVEFALVAWLKLQLSPLPIREWRDCKRRASVPNTDA